MNLVQKLWADEAGVVVSTELLLIVLILVLGLIAGMASLRDAVGQELADLGEAIGSLDGSYQFVTPVHTGESAADGSDSQGPSTVYSDNPDDNDTQTAADDPPEGMDIDGHIDTFNADNENANQ